MMKKIDRCNEEQHTTLVNERAHNSLEFNEDDFYKLRKLLDVFLISSNLERFDYMSEEGDYSLQEKPNQGCCFFEVIFEDSTFEEKKIPQKLSMLLEELNSEWMIYLSCLNSYFVTKEKILLY